MGQRPGDVDFRQFDPGENLPTTFRTEARVVYDDRFLSCPAPCNTG